jgi:hypothetical protein
VFLYRCCKSRPECCTCGNGYTRMFQVYVLNVSYVLDVCCKCFLCGCCKSRSGVSSVFHMYVASVLSGFLHMFATITHVFSSFLGFFKCFRHMLQMFQPFLTYVTRVSFGCCKSTSVLHILQWHPPIVGSCCSCWGAAMGHRAGA